MPKSVNGLHYRFVDGEGVPLVFVHGWLGNTESWARVNNFLDVPNPKLFYDQRCHGDSTCTRFATFDDLADDLEQLIDEMGLEQPVVIGHSMGGMVALTYATQNDCSGLVLLATCASTPEPVVESPRFFLNMLDEMDRGEWADMIVDNYVPEAEDVLLRRILVEELVEEDEDVLRWSLEAMVNFDVRDQITPVPAVVIGGKHDHAITPEKVTETAELLDTDVTLLDASHLVLHETPKAVARYITAFLADIEEGQDIKTLHRNTAHMIRTAEHKVPGGKLLRADVKFDETVEAVELHGDFFIYPEDAVEDIEAAFVGVAVEEDADELVNRIQDSLRPGAELVGFDPRDVVHVVKDAVQGDTHED